MSSNYREKKFLFSEIYDKMKLLAKNAIKSVFGKINSEDSNVFEVNFHLIFSEFHGDFEDFWHGFHD